MPVPIPKAGRTSCSPGERRDRTGREAGSPGPVIGEECVVYADLDLDQVAREQFALDTVGHYSRPDIFTLTVDTRKKPQVNWMRERELRPGPDRSALRTSWNRQPAFVIHIASVWPPEVW